MRPFQVHPRKSLAELESELYAAKMLLLNTYPSEVCSQLMSMYQRMVSHATQNANDGAAAAADQQRHDEQKTTDAYTITDMLTDNTASTSLAAHHLDNTPHDLALLPQADHVRGWHMCFGSAAAEARFARWLAMHSVHGDKLGARNTCALTIILQLVMCLRSSTLDSTLFTSTHAVAVLVWAAAVGMLSVAAITLASYWPNVYKTHRELFCTIYRASLVTLALCHSMCFWAPAPPHVSTLLTCFLAGTSAYPAVQLAVRWQYHTLLQLVELTLLLVSAPFLYQWHSPWRSHDNAEVLLVMLVIVFFGAVLPSLLLHSGERRLRFLFAEAQARTSA